MKSGRFGEPLWVIGQGMKAGHVFRTLIRKERGQVYYASLNNMVFLDMFFRKSGFFVRSVFRSCYTLSKLVKNHVVKLPVTSA